MSVDIISNHTPPEGFRHCVVVPIRFADLDAMGHVNNAIYQTYMESGRIQYFRDLGIWQDRHIRMIAPIMAKSTIEYKLPLDLDDGTIEVYTRCCRLGNKSYTMEHKIICYRNGNVEVVALGEAVFVAYDYRAAHSISVPDHWREQIRAYEPLAPVEESSHQ